MKRFNLFLIFLFLLNLTFGSEASLSSLENVTSSFELVFTEDESDEHTEIKDHVNFEKIQSGAGGDDDAELLYDSSPTIALAAIIAQKNAAVFYPTTLLPQYTLRLVNSCQKPELYILYCCSKDFLI